MDTLLNPELERLLVLRTKELKNEREKIKTLKEEVSKGIEEISKVYASQADLQRKLAAEEEKSNDFSTEVDDLKLSVTKKDFEITELKKQLEKEKREKKQSSQIPLKEQPEFKKQQLCIATLREELENTREELSICKETISALEEQAVQFKQSEGAKTKKLGLMSATVTNLRKSNLRLRTIETQCKTFQDSMSSLLSDFRQIIAILADEVQNFDCNSVDPNSLEDGNRTSRGRLEELYSNMENGLPDFQDDQEQKQKAVNDLLQINENLKGLFDYLSSKPRMTLASSSASSTGSATPMTSAGFTPIPGISYRDAIQASSAIMPSLPSMSPWSVDSHLSNFTSLSSEPLVSSPSALPQQLKESTASSQKANESLNGMPSLTESSGSDSQQQPLNTKTSPRVTTAKPNKFSCQVCDKYFAYENTLRNHLNTHLNSNRGHGHQGSNDSKMRKGNDSVSLSNKRTKEPDPATASSSMVISHSVDPNGENSSVCEHMAKKFSAESKFPCHICDKSFVEECYLLRHLKKHKVKCPQAMRSPIGSDNQQSSDNSKKGNQNASTESVQGNFDANESNVVEEIKIPQRSKPSISHTNINNANNLTFSPSITSAIENAGGLPHFQNCEVRLENIVKQEDGTLLHGYAKSKSNPKEWIFVCHCEREFVFRKSLDAHSRHHKNIQFLCNLCDKGFKQHNSLKTHIRRVHHVKCTGFGCDSCGSVFETRQKLTAHKKDVHYIGRKKPQVDLTMPTPRDSSQVDQEPMVPPIYMDGLVDEHHFVQN